MFLTCEHPELGEHLAGKPVFRKHSFDGVLYDEIGTSFLHLGDTEIFFTANVATVEHVLLLLVFLSRENNFVGIDHNNEISGVNVRRVGGLVPATKQIRDFYGEAAQDLVLGVDYNSSRVSWFPYWREMFSSDFEKKENSYPSRACQ